VKRSRGAMPTRGLRTLKHDGSVCSSAGCHFLRRRSRELQRTCAWMVRPFHFFRHARELGVGRQRCLPLGNAADGPARSRTTNGPSPHPAAHTSDRRRSAIVSAGCSTAPWNTSASSNSARPFATQRWCAVASRVSWSMCKSCPRDRPRSPSVSARCEGCRRSSRLSSTVRSATRRFEKSRAWRSPRAKRCGCAALASCTAPHRIEPVVGHLEEGRAPAAPRVIAQIRTVPAPRRTTARRTRHCRAGRTRSRPRTRRRRSW